ncbi:MAG: DUF3332 family protein [Myxococcota bacterium]
MKMIRTVALACVLGITAVAATGCHGKFALFKKVRDWNGTLGDKWINSVVHFAFWIVPVYPITLLGDLLIINTIEFWTDSNPVAQNAIGVSESGETVAVRLTTETGEEYVITSTRGQDAEVYRDGVLMGYGRPAADNEGWMFYDLEGGESRVASAEELAAAMP